MFNFALRPIIKGWGGVKDSKIYNLFHDESENGFAYMIYILKK